MRCFATVNLLRPKVNGWNYVFVVTCEPMKKNQELMIYSVIEASMADTWLGVKKKFNPKKALLSMKNSFCSDRFLEKQTESHHTLYCAATLVGKYMKSALAGHLHQLECVELRD